MLKAIILLCAIADFHACAEDTAASVMRAPGVFASPVTCALHGQAYLAQTSLVEGLREGFFLRVVCRPEGVAA